MSKLEVFEPAMCCPTGVCGPSIDPALVKFNADLQWLAEQGIEVARHNLSREPAAFVGNALVVREMNAGMDRLPLVLVDGLIVSTGLYPTRAQLAQKLGIDSVAAKPHVKLGSCGCKPGQC